MPKLTLAQVSFAGGELSPALYSRVDVAKYSIGLRTLRNWFVLREGGASNRAGTSFVCEVKDSSKATRLIPFDFNSSQTYVLEFGDQYMRVIQTGVQITETAKNITNITQANPSVVTSNSHGFSNGDEVYISGVSGMTQVNFRNFKVAGVTANTFQLKYMNGSNVNSTTFSAYVSSGTAERVYTISTPYLEADLFNLSYAQSADIIKIANVNYAPRDLSRTGVTSWTLSTTTFAPIIAAPTGVSNSGAAGSTTQWVVTAVASETLEESLQSSSTGSSATPTSGSPITVSWSAVTSAQEYNVYKLLNGIYGLIGIAGSTSFIDNGITPDTTDTPPIARNPFSGTNNYPACVNFSQQRTFYGGSNNNPTTVYGSRIGLPKNFTVSSPLQDDDAVTFSIISNKVGQVRNLSEVSGRFGVLTSESEHSANGDSNGNITPTTINQKRSSSNGCSIIMPLTIGENGIYLQARNSIVRDLIFSFEVDGYTGTDLTIFSSHLLNKYSIVDWTYQKIPNSIVWMVRNDGTLLGMTYLRDQQIVAWHHHDFGGYVESVCCVPEGNEDVLYLVIRRIINGETKRYIERMNNRQFIEIEDAIFVDSSVHYDGRNTNPSITMTLSNGTTWEYDETLTLTCSTAFFSASDVGNQIFLNGSDGTQIRFSIQGYTSSTVVTGFPQKTVPVSMRNVAVNDWATAVDQIGGLWHLEGQQVSVFADGFVVASVNNSSTQPDGQYVPVTVSNGSVTLEKPYSVIHVGLPITADIETLNINFSQGRTLADKNKLINIVNCDVWDTRGLFSGTQPPSDDSENPLENLIELKIRGDDTVQENQQENYDSPVNLATKTVEIKILSKFNANGRVFIRQVDPIPATITAIYPHGDIPLGSD